MNVSICTFILWSVGPHSVDPPWTSMFSPEFEIEERNYHSYCPTPKCRRANLIYTWLLTRARKHLHTLTRLRVNTITQIFQSQSIAYKKITTTVASRGEDSTLTHITFLSPDLAGSALFFLSLFKNPN